MMLHEENSNEKPKNNAVHHYSGGEIKYGWLKFRPSCLKIMLKPVVCLLILILCTVNQVMLQFLLPAVSRTLKSRYKLTDKDITGLQVAQGISLLISLLLVGHFGSFRRAKIYCIGAGMALTGFGAILFATPHFMTEDYKPVPDIPKLYLMAIGLCGRSSLPCSNESVESSHMALFVIGQILIGLGLAPLYCLIPAYIDENLNPKRMPLAILLWYINLYVGPMAGFAVGSMFQQVYIDIDQPQLLHQLRPDDFRWLGAWWLGYLLFGLITMFNAVIVSGLPVWLPGSQEKRDEHILKGYIPADNDKITQSISGLVSATTTLLKNKAFIFNTLANISIIFFLYTMGPFMVQMVMIKYGADPVKIIAPVIIVLLLGITVGIIVGGYLTYRISLKHLAKGAAFLCLATQALCILVPLLFVLPGCNESNIAGVTKEYPAIGGMHMSMDLNGSSEITALCNKNCKCSTFLSQPVCGSNNVAYFDPCHAGCLARLSENEYFNCTCVPPSVPGKKYGTAKKGFCDRGCGSWKVFVFVTFLAVVIFGANIVPSRVVVLRCVQNNQRSYALAVQNFLCFLVAFIPIYLVKFIMNRDCNIWQKDPCGQKGICWDYDTNSMSKSMTIFGMVVTALATTCYFFSWYVYKSPKTIKTNRLLSDTSTSPDNMDDDKETNL